MSARYQTIDRNVAEAIRKLHKKYPPLGHNGILKTLISEGIKLDPEELKRFLKQRGIKPDRSGSPLKWNSTVPAYVIGHGLNATNVPEGVPDDD
jgi:hypothetical protein